MLIKKSYDNLDITIKEEIEAIVKEDKYNLMAKTLYNNIKYSSGTVENLAKIFHVPVSLVVKIKEDL